MAKMHSLGADLHNRMRAFEGANKSMTIDAAGNGRYEMDDASMHPVAPKPKAVPKQLPAAPKAAAPVKRLATPLQRVALSKATAVSAARRQGPLAS